MSVKKVARFPKSRTVEEEAAAAKAPAAPDEKTPQEELAEIQAKAQALHQAKIDACARELQAILNKYSLSLQVDHVINLTPVNRS